MPGFLMLRALWWAHHRTLEETQRGEPFPVSLSLSRQDQEASCPESCRYFSAALATVAVRLGGTASLMGRNLVSLLRGLHFV